MTRLTLPLVAVLGALLGALLVGGYDRVAQPGGADRARIERVVHDYILADPDIVAEASQRLHDRETGKVIDTYRGAITTPYGNAWAGNARGDVTLVEYFDYNCGYCRASLPLIADLLRRDPKLRIVYRELPILAESSRDAARASLAAARAGKFAAFHAALYAAGPVSPATIQAATAGVGGFPALADPVADAELARNLETARAIGMSGTPTWVVGNRVLTGALPIDQIEAAIAAARGG